MGVGGVGLVCASLVGGRTSKHFLKQLLTHNLFMGEGSSTGVSQILRNKPVMLIGDTLLNS